jgi:NADH-quinone oxidoreductase subunit E
VLAGFPDGRVDEGPGAGPASLVGLELAREKKWTAPKPGQAKAVEQAGDSGTAETKSGAAAQADTARAQSETTQEEGKKSD